MNSDSVILPGQTIGIFGGGQLGRMLAMVARRTGYRVHVYSSEVESPASHFANQVTVGDYDDQNAFREFVANIDVLTLEFENVSSSALDQVPAHVPVRPGKNVLYITQNRSREKAFLREHSIPCPEFALIGSLDELKRSLSTFSLPAVLKTSDGGYDGKGQFKIEDAGQADEAWAAIDGQPATLECFVDLLCEVSVIIGRDVMGNSALYGPIENRHANHILDVSFVPSRVSEAVSKQAIEIAKQIADRLELIGLICVEFFVTTNGDVLVNEIAPRPHNSGHLTIEAFATSQFEQQLRCICGLPVGDANLIRPAAMTNLLGDCWGSGTPYWQAIALQAETHLHLYDKQEPRIGRKMGHITSTARNAEEAVARATTAREQLCRSQESV
ncbi:MAG: 5-(carboxyamino)imidazole ribonucleotide synthase [Pirellulaceae bacterium]